jgi:hypothetical protein
MGQKVPVKVRIWIAERSQAPRASWKTTALTAALLTGAVGLVIGGSWLAVRLIVNPGSLTWLNHMVPSWSGFAVQPQTLAEITAEVSQSGWAVGPLIHFSTYAGMTRQRDGFHDVLVPIVQAGKHCNSQSGRNCAAIVELRVYRPISRFAVANRGVTYELVDRIAVTGPEELAAIAHLTHTTITQGSTRTLPLTDVNFIAGKAPTSDIWFHLSGEWKRGSRVLYGKVIRYDTERQRLYSVQAWSSPVGQLPQWQQVTGDDKAELVVDQTIGLEPHFQVYQLQPPRSSAQTMTLEAVSLTEAALRDRTYANGLLLARHGLWSSALQVLKAVKQKGNWSPTAQAQLDVIALHAKITQTQADRDWASPTQQILAQVMDGRWSKALSLLKSAHSSGYDIENLLQRNVDRLWQRVEAALRVNPRQADLQTWGTLVLAVKQNREQAIAWLQKQPDAAKDSSIEQTLALLEPSPVAVRPRLADPSATFPAAAATPTATPAALIGVVIPIATVQPADWLAAAALTLDSQQVWYRVEVVEFDDQRWQGLTGVEVAATPVAQQAQKRLSLLGLDDPQLQIVAWQGATPVHTLTATVKAVQVQQGKLALLAAGDKISEADRFSTIVAVTPNTISWAQASTTQTLTELAQQQHWKEKLIPQLWKNLQTANLVPSTAQPSDPLQTIGDWSVQRMELTGDQTPEAVLTIELDAGIPPRTVVFSESAVLYSDLQSSDRFLMAIANRSNSNLAMLIIMDTQELIVQEWSIQHQRFE